MKKRKQQLTPKQEIFIHELLADPAMNATKSAEKAGYSKKTAKVQGYQLLQKPLIKAAIEQAQEKRIQRLEISADQLSQFWAAIVFTPISEFYNEDPDGTLVPKPLNELSDEAMKCVAKISNYVKADGTIGQSYELLDKMRASENLARSLGMFIDKHQVFGKDGENLSINVNFIAPGSQQTDPAITVEPKRKELPPAA